MAKFPPGKKVNRGMTWPAGHRQAQTRGQGLSFEGMTGMGLGVDEESGASRWALYFQMI